mgnify:CR=1 FL=1
MDDLGYVDGGSDVGYLDGDHAVGDYHEGGEPDGAYAEDGYAEDGYAGDGRYAEGGHGEHEYPEGRYAGEETSGDVAYPEEEWDGSITRKIEADIFIDDRNLGGFVEWGRVWQLLFPGESDLEVEKQIVKRLRRPPFWKRWFSKGK